jgi:superfamily II DNA or RNA helicase
VAELRTLLGQLDERPSVKAAQFENLTKWVLDNTPLYKHFVRRTWLWKDWPERWGVDAGIDIVAETNDRTLWAVQCKAYDSSHSITKRDVDTFLTESNTGVFVNRLLVATTDHLSQQARGAMARQEKPVTQLLLGDLERLPVEWPRSFSELLPPRSEKKTPFPHNQRAVDDVCRALEDHRRAQLHMACGTGKTLVGLWTSEKIGSHRTLVVVPSLSLVAQTLREWTANCDEGVAFLPVCSDESVGANDESGWNTYELGVPATTDPRDIRRFLERPRLSVVISTYQSVDRVAAAQAAGAPSFDLLIADEAHRCVGPASAEFARVLDDEAVQASRRLFMTATPRYLVRSRRLSRRKTGGEQDTAADVVSMDDEALFGPVAHRLTFGEAIESGLLADYRVVIVGVDNTEVFDAVQRRVLLTAPSGGPALDAATLGSQVGLLQTMRKYGLRRVLTFHNRVARASSFASTLTLANEAMPPTTRVEVPLRASHVSGAMSTGLRSTRLRELRLANDDAVVVGNARCLSEGVDVPILDAVAFIEPRGSQVDVIQAVGRAIRRASGKTVGTVVLPVFVPQDQDPTVALESSAFKSVWEVVRALRAHDEMLSEELDRLRRQLGQRPTSQLRAPARLVFDLPANLPAAFFDSFIVRLVKEATPVAEEYFGAATSFAAREGHLVVPVDHIENRLALGAWITNLRRRHRLSEVPADIVARVEALPGWTWNPLEDQWFAKLGVLREFQRREGHAAVDPRHVEGEVRLGKWVSRQRESYQRGRLPEEQRLALESVPGWSWAVKADRWEERFRLLQQFFERERHYRVPHTHIEDGVKLGLWLSEQNLKHNRGLLPASKVLRFERLPGWAWRAPRRRAKPSQDTAAAGRWSASFEALQAFAAANGHALVARHEPGWENLGQWVQTQRGAYRRGLLDPRRQELLEGVPGWTWDPSEDRWQRGLELLEQYVAEHGNADVPNRYVMNGFELGGWVKTQRKSYLYGRLRPHRLKVLETVPGWRWRAGAGESAFRRQVDTRTVLEALLDAALRSGGTATYEDVRLQLGISAAAMGNHVRRLRHNGTLLAPASREWMRERIRPSPSADLAVRAREDT